MLKPENTLCNKKIILVNTRSHNLSWYFQLPNLNVTEHVWNELDTLRDN